MEHSEGASRTLDALGGRLNKPLDLSVTLCAEILRLLASSGSEVHVARSALRAALAHIETLGTAQTLNDGG
jgi:hypothetical protein